MQGEENSAEHIVELCPCKSEVYDAYWHRTGLGWQRVPVVILA